MKFAKRLIILGVIATAAMIWGGVRNSSCDCGVPLAFLAGIFTSSPEKAAEAGGQHGHAAVEHSAANTGAVYAAQKATDAVVTFIELGSVNCIPCKMMQPVMRQIERKYGSQVKIIFYDVWTPAGRPYAQKYGIQAIPTQVFLDRNGKEYFRHIGYFPFEEVDQVLKKGGVR